MDLLFDLGFSMIGFTLACIYYRRNISRSEWP